ncbi:MAG: outer membrane lipoprotein chaperone LolA [Pseudomonadota bacterium]
MMVKTAKYEVYFVLAVLASSPIAASQAAMKGLEAQLANMNSYEADFVQSTVAVGQPTYQALGHIEFQKPNLIRWNQIEPEETLMVADGEYLWQYEPDLEQVIQQPQSVLKETPFAILMTPYAQWKADYLIEYSYLPESCRSMECFSLTPKVEAPVRKIVLGFEQGILAELHLWTALGDESHLVMAKQRLNGRLPPEEFRFIPPDSIDVIKLGDEQNKEYKIQKL